MSYELVNAKNISDFYNRLGAYYYCSQVTTGSIKSHHKEYVNRWLNFIKEFARICIGENQLIQNPDVIMVRKLLYKHFPCELKDEISYLYCLNQVHRVYSPDVFSESVLRCLNLWLEGEDYVKSV